MIRYKMYFQGKVQRVGFRNFVAATAEQYQLTGYVKNLANGKVEAQVQGKAEAISQFLEKINQGNKRSQINDLSLEQISICQDDKAFMIKRFPFLR